MTHEYKRGQSGHALGVPKLVGADTELGNLKMGPVCVNGTGREASQALLREVDGVPGTRPEIGGQENPQDMGRRYLATNGGCVYIDLDHLEVCTPEVVSAFDFLAAWHGMLRIGQDALAAANAKCPPNERIVALVNSSDGLGNSYGSHLSFLVTRRLWDDLFSRRLHPELFVLAAHQVSSIVYTGQGKIGSENHRPPVGYQISQRADFFDQLVGPQTTYNRPIVNSRDEPLCGTAWAHAPLTGGSPGLARLHCIFYDSSLCHVSTVLKVGVMQIVLRLLEAGQLDASLMLEDPLTALLDYSHDPGLSACARLADGRAVTAVQLQTMFCERARAYVDRGGCDGLVPDAAAIIELWEDTLCKLAGRDFDALAPRLDWVLKQAQIERALANHGLDWSGPAAKHLDHIYSSLDPAEGVFWVLEKAGLTETLVDDGRIERFRHAPPEDTRAWTRAMLLRRLPRDSIHSVDWDRIELAATMPGAQRLVVPLPNPLGHTRASWTLDSDERQGDPNPTLN